MTLMKSMPNMRLSSQLQQALALHALTEQNKTKNTSKSKRCGVARARDDANSVQQLQVHFRSLCDVPQLQQRERLLQKSSFIYGVASPPLPADQRCPGP